MIRICDCNHSRTRHRACYGEPGAGACNDCPCSAFTAGHFRLTAGERRLLGKIGESGRIGYDVLRQALHDDGDDIAQALDVFVNNLAAAHFIHIDSVGLYVVSATPGGRRYLEENPARA